MITPCLNFLEMFNCFSKCLHKFTHQYCVEVLISSVRAFQYLLMFVWLYPPFSGWAITHHGIDLHAQDGY